MPIKIRWSSDSISGTRKKINDDSLIIFSAGTKGSAILEKDGEHQINDSDLIFAISDGMGGANAGNLASKILLEKLSEIVPNTIKLEAQGFTPDYSDQLENAILQIHESINAYADENPECEGMGATITLAWFTPENLYIGHVGDSRLYLNRDNITTQITEDHNLIWKKLKQGLISETEFRRDSRRSILYEVVGSGYHSLNPQILVIPYHANDRFMLCSDGIVEGLNQKKISLHLNQNQDSTSATLQSLISTSVDNCGEDDTTCIVFDLQD